MNSAQELINVINANLSDYDKPLQDLGNMLVDVLIASILNTNPIVSVSYTHLDGYKRQNSHGLQSPFMMR